MVRAIFLLTGTLGAFEVTDDWEDTAAGNAGDGGIYIFRGVIFFGLEGVTNTDGVLAIFKGNKTF